jgi:hypothetical protein
VQHDARGRTSSALSAGKRRLAFSGEQPYIGAIDGSAEKPYGQSGCAVSHFSQRNE